MFDFGNRVELKAPAKKFREVGVDTFEGPFADYLIGDYYSLAGAEKAAKSEAGEMKPVYVCDDQAKMVFSAGNP